MRSAHAELMLVVLATPAKTSARRVSRISTPINARDKAAKAKFSSIKTKILALLILTITNCLPLPWPRLLRPERGQPRRVRVQGKTSSHRRSPRSRRQGNRHQRPREYIFFPGKGKHCSKFSISVPKHIVRQSFLPETA